MIWLFTVQDALFLAAIVIFGLIGFDRGWRYELIALLFILLALGFLFLNGGVYLAQLLSPFLLDMGLTKGQLIIFHRRFVLTITYIALVLIAGLGYFIVPRWFPSVVKVSSVFERTLGFLLGAIIGAVVAAYVTTFLFPDTQTSVITRVIIEPLKLGPYLIANFTAVVIFLIALVVVIIGLVTLRIPKWKPPEKAKEEKK
jgi:MFS family permease